MPQPHATPYLSVHNHSTSCVSGPCSVGSSTTFPRLTLGSTIFAPAHEPASLAMVSWPSCAGSVFDLWENQSRYRRGPPPDVLEAWRRGRHARLGCRIHSAVLVLARVVPSVPWKGSRPPGSSHRLTPTSTHGTQLHSACVSQDGESSIPRSLSSCCRPTWAWTTACSSALPSNSRCTWVGAMLCCHGAED